MEVKVDPLSFDQTDVPAYLVFSNESSNIIYEQPIEEVKYKPHTCFFCNKSFTEVDDLFAHIKIHNGEKSEPDSYNCLVCQKNFENENTLNVHMSINHKGIKPYRCPFCVKRYSQKDTLDVHLLSHKDVEMPYNCTMCKMKFKTIIQLTEHMSGAHNKSFNCTECVKCFGNISELTKHKRTHSMERPFKCEICDETFSQQSSLQLHVKKVHENKDERNFKCTLCDYSFLQSSDLTTHMFIHIDDGPFECPDCADLFEDLKMYQEHMRVHENFIKNEEKITKELNSFDTELTNLVNETLADDEFPIFVKADDFYTCLNCCETFTDLFEFQKHQETHNKLLKKSEIKQKVILMKKTDKPKKSRAPVSLAWQEKDNKVRNFRCKLCDRSFTLASTLTLHNRRTHLGIKPYECSVCKWSFAQSSDLIKHMRKHTGERPYTCTYCGLGFTQNRNLKNHMKMHTEQPSKCKYCEKEFALDTSLLQHLKKHEGPEAVECDVCQIPFTNQNDLKIHKKRLHSDGLKPHICTVCKKAFAKSCDLKKHQRIHTGERPYICHICDKTFTHPTSLRNHRAVHTGEKPFQCSFCGQAFAFSGNLKVHIRSHTGEKPFPCTVCPKKFARTANLNEHMKIHTGVKSYKCTVCDKSFTNSSTFSKHKKIHTGEKPHKCPLCSKAFIQFAHLTKHIRVHTGEKPFPCSICNKHFRRSDTLAAHMKTHRVLEQSIVEPVPEQPQHIVLHMQDNEMQPQICYNIVQSELNAFQAIPANPVNSMGNQLIPNGHNSFIITQL